MKKVLSFIILSTLIIVNQVFAISYYDEIKLTNDPSIPNNDTNINGAKLIEKYLVNLKNEIVSFNEKYDINKDSETVNFFKTLDKMISSLRKIQTTNIERNSAVEVMNSVVKDLKTLNPKVKNYLKNKKMAIQIETKNVKNNYINFSYKLSVSLTTFTKNISSKISKNKNKNAIIVHLKNLGVENNRLLTFSDLDFNNPSEVKNAFISILSNIKKEFIEIKKLIR
ncbi:MAG: hypothetical protein PHN31_03160 [Candidatus Gracilibacteria bacterium]|nr:hypothetical protein [Candidatus Gracilibacteria bacterium]